MAAVSIDYTRCRVTLDGEPVELTATECAALYELASHALWVLNHGALLKRVWGQERLGQGWLPRGVVKKLRRKMVDNADDPRYVIAEPRVGCRMAAGEGNNQLSGVK